MADRLGEVVEVTVEQVQGVYQFGFHQGEGGSANGVGEEVGEFRMNLVAGAVDAVLDGDRVRDQELVQAAVFAQGSERFGQDTGGVGLALLEDLGDVIGVLEVVLGLAGDGVTGVLGLATANGGSGVAGAVQEVTLGAPEDVGGLEDEDGGCLKGGGEVVGSFDHPEHILEVIVADDTLGEDLLALREGVGKDYPTDVAVRVDPGR